MEDTPNEPLTCRVCGSNYQIDEFMDAYMEHPINYSSGCDSSCLACWLGVGPLDCPDGSKELAELIRKVTVACADDGEKFTRSERIDVIRELLAKGAYLPAAEAPLALLWTHRNFNPSLPCVLVSSHIDSLYQEYHATLENDVHRGTFDNSITNAAVLSAMLAESLSPQVIVAFTGDEEHGSKGARQAVTALGTMKPASLVPAFVIVLDITEEAYGTHFCTFENLHGDTSGAYGMSPVFADEAGLADWIRAVPRVEDPHIVESGEPDEAWEYARMGFECCSFCLPCKPVTGDMHDDEGVLVLEWAAMDYAGLLTIFSNQLVELLEQRHMAASGS